MKTLLLLLLCHSSSAVEHSLKFVVTMSSGPKPPTKFVALGFLDDIEGGHCDSNTYRVEPKQWSKKAFDENLEHVQLYNMECGRSLPLLRLLIHQAKQHFHHSEGVHVLQAWAGCEWDDETGEVDSFLQFGYDGEDFLSLDLKTQTWVAAKPQAVIIKLLLDADTETIKLNVNLLNRHCPGALQMYWNYGKDYLLRRVPPSVSLLQKTPYSPVSCHATGFYPHRALMFWTKDGEELYEDVDQGEILPNHDGSFQMSVDLDVSSVKAEDWRRYDCVFQLSGLKDDIVTKLDKAHIRTNMETPSDLSVIIIPAVVVLLTLVLIFCGFMIYRKAKQRTPPAPPVNSSELHERLSPES